MKSNKNIILVGFMGSGKTTVGKVLASQLKYDFIDTDHLIVKNEKTDIPVIFDSQGESYFRKAERHALKQAMSHLDVVIATGGGIITIPENDIILGQGIVIYLEATPEQIYRRLKNDQSRPLLQGEDVYGKICRMLKQREALYKQAADYVVLVDNKTPEEICKLILNDIK